MQAYLPVTATFMAPVLLFSILILIGILNAATIPDEEFGYIDVRENAHMVLYMHSSPCCMMHDCISSDCTQFYWFYGSSNPHQPRDDLPIVLWLQGGPGAGGSGYGNFGEMGPLNANLQPRTVGAWTEKGIHSPSTLRAPSLFLYISVTMTTLIDIQ